LSSPTTPKVRRGLGTKERVQTTIGKGENMNLSLKWHRSLKLLTATNKNQIYTIDLNCVPEKPGIYIFFRVHGKKHEALYVGKAENLFQRVSGEFNNLKLMKGIENATNGTKGIIFAEYIPKPGQQLKKSLHAIEKTLIRHYLSEGHDLFNIKGTKLQKDSLTSDRDELRKFIPQVIYRQKN